jgi:tRNA threonylcarbamoyl adenosine modification protein YeaZ
VLLLALDTATPAVTVAVHDGTAVLAEATAVDPRRHGELLAPMLHQALATAGVSPRDLTDIAVGVGPGPFTGLRVGLVTTRTLAAVTGARLVGVCTLDVVAQAVQEGRQAPTGGFAVALDARRKEVHWATYDELARRLDGPGVLTPASLADRLGPASDVFGRGAQLYGDVLSATQGPLDPDAAVLARAVLAQSVELGPAEPLYLRRPDVTMPGPAKPVS